MKVQFAQAIKVEAWITIELPDDFTEEEIEDYVQEFPMDVNIIQPSREYVDAEFHVHSINYDGPAEVQEDKNPDVS